jgi:hypothetical protein
MNIDDLEARLRDLPPDLPDPHDHLAKIEGRVRRRRTRRRIGTAVVGVAALSIAIPLAMLAGLDAGGQSRGDVATDSPSPSPATELVNQLPGADLVVRLSTSHIARHSGTATVDLGERPAGATAVSTDLTCLSPGTFRWPDGASLVCNAKDAALAADRPTSTGYVIELAPTQTQIVIEADADASWRISTTYVRVEPTEWGVTANGETFGVPNDAGEPDLVAIGGPDSEITYGRSEDLNVGAANPDEAMAWMKNGKPYAIPTYTEDGRTIVGTFAQSDGTTQSGGPSEAAEEQDQAAITLIVGSAPAGAEKGVASGLLTVSELKVKAAKEIVGSKWDDLVSAGFSEATLTTLQKGRTDLDELADSIRRTGHVSGTPAKFFAKRKDGEVWLEGLLGATTKGVDKQVWRNTQSFFGSGRYFDVLIGRVAHESKVGYVKWSKSIENQIKKDAWLVQQASNGVDSAHWHFFASSASNTIGADKRLLDLLDQNNIPYTIHRP